MLLSFSAENFRCFANEATLDLIHPSLKTVRPHQGASWATSTWRVAAIFGANASGKSTLLGAIDCLVASLSGQRALLHQPYSLSDANLNSATSYAVEFIHEDQRYEYRVEAQPWGITREELWAQPYSRKLFVRTQQTPDTKLTIKAGPSLRGATQEVRRITTAQDLFLAMALRYQHATLAPIAHTLSEIRTIHHSDEERSARLTWLMSRLAERPTWWNTLSDAVAHSADLGIASVELEEKEVPSESLDSLRRLLQAANGEEVEIPEAVREMLGRSLRFLHRGPDGHTHSLPLQAQSQGTLTWLATVGPSIEALHEGKTLLIDELDASLHPTLVATLVEMFKDPDLNPLGAQLIFTTHDATLLANSPTQLLEAGEVWMCEKNLAGQSEIFSLADFDSLRRGTNKQKQYLAGAFGAIPIVDLSPIRRALTHEEPR
ncbi:AAA family ATPase [Actinomyces faecalis]|uniref:AAA family ATPase n=1 Tax=Actinomyces faecalis TaxID=2722820 RepID=UPI0015566F7A|nr:ATP-binding protein [Actinomyces faecalis]